MFILSLSARCWGAFGGVCLTLPNVVISNTKYTLPHATTKMTTIFLPLILPLNFHWIETKKQVYRCSLKIFGYRYNTLRCNDMLPPPSAIYICNEINEYVVAWWLKHWWFPVVCDFKTLCVALWEWNFPLEWSWWSGFDRSICPSCFGGARRSHNHDSLAPVIIGLVYANLSSNNQGRIQDFKLGGGSRISS